MAKNILITGAGGFLGACATYYFSEKGNTVYAGVRRAEGQWRLGESKAEIALIDVASAASVESAVSKTTPHAIINFAAYGAYPTREKDEKLMHATNVEGVSNLISAAKRHGVEKFVHIGSSSEYGQKNAPMSEGDAMHPDTPYGKTKLEGAQIVKENSDALDACVLRPFSPYGPWEDGKRLVPTLIKAALSGASAKLSSPHPMRDFIFVDDLNEAIGKAIAADGISGEAFNVGSGRQVSVAQMAQIVNTVIPTGKPPEYGSVENPRNEPPMWQADISKAKKMLGWAPATTHEVGIAKTSEWMMGHLKFYE